jgi:hypothetical protein
MMMVMRRNGSVVEEEPEEKTSGLNSGSPELEESGHRGRCDGGEGECSPNPGRLVTDPPAPLLLDKH